MSIFLDEIFEFKYFNFSSAVQYFVTEKIYTSENHVKALKILKWENLKKYR